jgi:hypothetical protein
MSSLYDVVKNKPFTLRQSANLVLSSKDKSLISTPEMLKSTGMVELSGIEPLTPCLQSRCSPS